MSGLLIGGAVGALAVAGASRVIVRRSVARARAAERRLRAAERQAEAASMTRGLAHEIRNPLSTIGLNAQLLAEGIAELELDEADRARLGRRVEALGREAERLRGILEDFLEFAGELRLEPTPGDLNAVVEELVDFFLPQAQSQGVRLRAEPSTTPLRASIDAPHLKQAVLNLMLNAVQAMSGASGERARELILRTERVQDADRRSVVRLHVIDTGPGIDAETAGRLFDPYFTTKPGGTGLGLPTARRIIEGMGGRIELHSEPGKGTDFTITLPELSS
ncbi:MAG: ATP-binding protein [Phycisphaerales bacterium]